MTTAAGSASANPELDALIRDCCGKDKYLLQPDALKELEQYRDDAGVLSRLGQIKADNKKAFAAWVARESGVILNTDALFDVQVKRLHEYKRQLLNVLHIIYLYQRMKADPHFDFTPRTYLFGAKAAPGYFRAKGIIKYISEIAKLIDGDPAVRGRMQVLFITNYGVSYAEKLMPAAEISEQISTAGTEASGTSNMKFMLNGALTLGTMDGANVEIVEEVGADNAFIFGMSSDEVINYENNGGYYPMDIFNNDQEIRRVLMQLINGYYAPQDTELFRDIYDSLLNTKSSDRADTYFILADFKAYAEAQKRVEEAYKDEAGWAKKALLNTACSGKFTSDRTIQQYVDEIWHLDKVTVDK